jgi:hypothetical protein
MQNVTLWMGSFEEQHRTALMSCIELVLMRKSNTNYHLVQAKLNAICNRNLIDCYDYPKYLRDVLKDVYKVDYISIIDEIKSELGELVEEKDIAKFLKIMER